MMPRKTKAELAAERAEIQRTADAVEEAEAKAARNKAIFDARAWADAKENASLFDVPPLEVLVQAMRFYRLVKTIRRLGGRVTVVSGYGEEVSEIDVD